MAFVCSCLALLKAEFQRKIRFMAHIIWKQIKIAFFSVVWRRIVDFGPTSYYGTRLAPAAD